MKRAIQMFALTLTLLPILAAAQLGANGKLTARVPFEFRAGNKVIPAGDCSLQADGNVFTIHNVAAKKTVVVLAMRENQPTGNPAGYALLFHKYGDRYFLAGIRQSGKTIERMPATKLENELRAQNAPATEEVLLASLK